MNVSCPECGSVFRVDPAKIPVSGVRARCSVCGGVIPIGSTGRIESDFTASVPDAVTTATPRAQSIMTSASVTTAAAHPTPAVFRTLAPTPAAVPRQGAPAAPAAPAAPLPRAPGPRITGPVPRQSGSSAPVAAPAVRPAAPVPPAPPLPAAAPPPPPPPPAPAAPAAHRPTRAPINPFLANDPNVKARRLARALVSDIIAYFPEKHADGLRAGTLRELFREEIKKSYEEYVDQMGREFAESTTHFQDALNDVLAGGKKVF